MKKIIEKRQKIPIGDAHEAFMKGNLDIKNDDI